MSIYNSVSYGFELLIWLDNWGTFMIRKYTKAALLLLMILICSSTTGCVAMIANNYASKEKVFQSDNGNGSITASSMWSDDDGLNKDSIIHISNIIKDAYVVVLQDTKDSFGEDMTLSDYTDIVKSNLESEVVNAYSSEIKDASVNGYNAKYYELTGEYSDINITYMYYCVETSDSYYQIIGWTKSSEFKANEQELKNIMNSFNAKKEL